LTQTEETALGNIDPDVVLSEIHAIVFEVLATVAELPPILLPLGDGFLRGARKVGVFTFLRVDGLRRKFEFDRSAFEVLALDKSALGGVSVDTETILFVFLAGLVDMCLLRLLRFKPFLDCGQMRFTMLCLTGNKGGDRIFDFVSNPLRKLQVEDGLLVRLLSQGIERVAEFASGGMSMERRKHRGQPS
jgi:hypothetical protein